MPSAEFLLIDIGNTHAKMRLASEQRLSGSTRRIPTADLLNAGAASRWHAALDGWRYDAVVLASVVPVASARMVRVLGGAALLRIHPGLDTGVDLRGYPGRKTLGADRLADIAGAWALYGPGPMIVADLGTAAVFNAIDASGAFLGGVIAPGLAAIHGSLPAHTAQLPRIKLQTPARAIGRTTREALLAGAVCTYRGMIREILAALRAELGGARLVATGGDLSQLVGQTTPDDILDPNLTMQGLRIIARRNRGQFRPSGEIPSG
jgi:type III pantothenate kinase